MFKRAALLSASTLLIALCASSSALAGVAAPLSPAPAQVAFGEVDLHFGGTPRQNVKFTDETGPVTLESATISGSDAADFQIVANGCSGQLEVSENCSIEVELEHGARGSYAATLELVTDEGTVEVPLSASAITGTLAASPDPLAFSAIPFTAPGTHSEGEYRESQQITVQNSNAGTQIEAVSLTGPDASSYAIEYDGCPGDLLAPNNSCSIGIRFQPTSPGPKEASILIESDAGASPLTIPLQGEGLHGPQLSIDTTQALLGDVALGGSAQHAFAVSNTGDYPLYIQRALLLTGTPLMFPVLHDSCSAQILYPGDSCQLVVGFQPTTPGEKDAAILFITNTPAFNVVGIDGVGVAAGTSAVTPPPASPQLTVQGTRTRALPLAPGRARGAAQLLSVHRAPHLYSLLGRASVDTGVIAQCPPELLRCQVVSAITASIHRQAPRSTSHASRRATLLLGSAFQALLRGQTLPLRVSLTKDAIALLARRGHLHVTIVTFIRAGRTVISEHTQMLTLSAPRTAGGLGSPGAPR